MQRPNPFLASAIFLALLAGQSATSWAQSPRHQTMAFGGGTSFDFLIPVQAKGPIWIEASVDPGVPVDAYLFSPRYDHPVAVAHGPGKVSFAHQVTGWKAGDQWMVRIAARNGAENVRGSLRVTWPAGNRFGVAVQWHNAGPTDPVLLAQMRERLRDLRSQLTGGEHLVANMERRESLDEVATILETRLDLLARTPVRHIRNDGDGRLASAAPQTAPGRLPTWQDAVSVSFVELECVQHKGWHVDHEGDQPYVAAAIVPGDDGEVIAGRTPVFRFVRGGDEPSTVAGDGELARTLANGKAQIVLALLERENGDLGRSMDRFAQAVELYTIYASLDGSRASDQELGWLLALTAGGSDEIIGTPHLITVTPDGIYNGSGALVAWATGDPVARGALQRLAFTGLGAEYAVAVKVRAERVGR